jgi:adenosylmethionine-8-amino-7-oxononanoate aminotransferase
MSAPPECTRAAAVSADLRHLIHPQHFPPEHAAPVIWASGRGSELTDTGGRTYLDGLSSMWNVSLGQARPELVKAASRQLSTLSFGTAYAGTTHEPAIRLAETLREIVPPNIEAFFFTSGGSEATETSIRTVRWFWRALGKPQKSKIIARDLSYHGSSVAASSATGVDEFSAPFGPRLPGFLHIPSPYPYRFNGTGRDAADLLEAAILREGPETVAAFIAEPIQGGGGGVIVPQDDYFQRIREICDRYDVLLIADEVITGFARTGRWFALEHWGVQPDILQFAKGITSGYVPMGGIGISARTKQVMDSAASGQRWWHGYTCSAHPLGCAVALETLRIIREEKLVERSAVKGARLLATLRAELGSHPNVGEIRGLGLMAAVEIVADRETKMPFPDALDIGGKLRAELFRIGLYTRVLGGIVCLAPPLTSTEPQLDRIAALTIEAIRNVLAKL